MLLCQKLIAEMVCDIALLQGAEETYALKCTSQQSGVALSSALDAISEARKLRDQRSLFARKTDAGSAELYFHCALLVSTPAASPLWDRGHCCNAAADCELQPVRANLYCSLLPVPTHKQLVRQICASHKRAGHMLPVLSNTHD